jgi:hypothetical protein
MMEAAMKVPGGQQRAEIGAVAVQGGRDADIIMAHHHSNPDGALRAMVHRNAPWGR